jgi:hypothetical protein
MWGKLSIRESARLVSVLTLDLQVRDTGPSDWEVACLDSPAGQSAEPVLAPSALSPAARQARRNLEQQVVNDLEMDADFIQLGIELGRQLLPSSAGTGGNVASLLEQSLGSLHAAVQASNTRGVLRLRLRLHPEAAHDVPWEAAFCPAPKVKPGWLAVHPDLAMVRFVPLPVPCALPPCTDKLRILLCHAMAPANMPSLDYKGEWAAIHQALGPARVAGQIDLVEELLDVTEARLRQKLQTLRPHLVHLTAHGEPGKLFLADGGHSAAKVADIFHGQPVRLIVFNVCHSVRVGRAVAAAGIPCVVAMHCEISDQFAVRFSERFYGALLGQGRSVDEAMLAARDGLVSWPDAKQPPAAWCVPVLYTRLREGYV